MSIWPTEVTQCASSVIPVHALNQADQHEILSRMNQMFLNRVSPQEIQKTAHAWARKKQIVDFRPDVENGLVVVGFAGGGGSCEGIKQALGFEPHIAMNHNPVAMAMHAVNHPRTLHYPEDIFSVDPLISTGGLPVLLGWFSPDCRHFSKAKGGTPVKKEIRGLAWVVLRWALAVRPKYLMMENVEEFRTWGPLLADKHGHWYPDPARTGETFRAFVGMLSNGVAVDCPALAEACEFLKIDIDSDDAKRLVTGLGYNVDHKELRACDYGAPTIRKRLFLVGRCDGEPVAWPEPSHGAPDSAAVLDGQIKPWRTAAECIDWSIPTRSIFGRKKDLADNTLRRIVKGMQRFVIDNPDPYIVQIGQTGFGGDGRQYSTEQPLTTVTSKAEHLLIEPHVVKCNHTSNRTKYDCFRGQSGRLPLQTVTQTLGFAVAAPVVVRQFGASTAQRADAPVGTVMPGGGGKTQLASATLIQMGYGERVGQAPRVLDLEKPLGTVVAGGIKHALVAANLVKHYGGNYTGAGLGVDEPLHTITQVDHHTLCTSHLVQLYGTCKHGRKTTEPAPTVTSQGQHTGHVQAFLQKYYGNEKDGIDVDAPMHTVPTHDRFGLVEARCEVEPLTDELRYSAWWCARLMEDFSDEPDDSHLFPVERPQYIRVGDYVVVDICMRMLEPRELYNANGFPRSYIIDKDIDGTKWPKSEQVARCGNAVPPPFAEALVRANMPDFCIWEMAA
ncbi:DNA cytosine methyltransferase [Serratia fonticola]|uniref:DNA cytosine methyltransferase n=1 Tax=Serratia fonticola TaxID=47917 RepID=UPI001AE14B11|nr:DNA cytosine methyltransferase [Serratia fonticola]MBP0999909.1 DNA cytosine methyltransferase [Serratia fonticola]MBP1004264.1 DNA cytosine methyltransferase [Serratia fonticola]MBP1014256.1 DNA cytosine methyltransferase [Serratia fonticola]